MKTLYYVEFARKDKEGEPKVRISFGPRETEEEVLALLKEVDSLMGDTKDFDSIKITTKESDAWAEVTFLEDIVREKDEKIAQLELDLELLQIKYDELKNK